MSEGGREGGREGVSGESSPADSGVKITATVVWVER